MAGSSAPRPATDRVVAAADPARRVRAVLLELALGMGLTLACFSGFLALMEISFPKGQSLHSLIATQVEAAPPETAPEPGTVAPPPVKSLASLEVMRRSVMSRKAGAIAWGTAATGLALHDGDGVQTGNEGRAQIAFGEAVRLELEKNTLVVVSDPELGASSPDASERPRGVVIAEGELWARLRSGTQERVAITLPGATASLGGRPESRAALQVQVRRNGRSSLAIQDGTAAVRGGAGRTMAFGPSQYVRVGSDGTISAPLPLPSPPKVEGPGAGASFGYIDLPPRIPFRWQAVDGAQQYRLRAARDSAFHEVVLDETVAQPSLTWGRLQPGTYFWHVAAVTDDIDGLPSAPRRLVVKRDEGKLKLEVEAPRLEGLTCHVAGHAARRAKVFVMGQQITIESDGAFQTDVQLSPGANILLVEAVDAAGHSTYWSQVVHAKP